MAKGKRKKTVEEFDEEVRKCNEFLDMMEGVASEDGPVTPWLVECMRAYAGLSIEAEARKLKIRGRLKKGER